MSKVKCIHLLRLAQYTQRLQPESLCPETARYISTSSSSRVETGAQGQKASQGNPQTSGFKSGSSTYQSYHRTAYERKKQDYQRDRTEQRSRGRPVSYLSSPTTTHYQRLSIEPGAEIDKIKSAYYSLSKQYHPDIVGKDNPDATENFRLITESYDTLSDPKTRAEYDKQFVTEVESMSSPTQTAWKPAGSNNRENETLYRMREANRIFRIKQEDALERERDRNPAKFRAGSFKYDDDDVGDSLVNIQRLENQIRSIKANKSFKGRGSAESEFYRVHLFDTLLRRRQDLEDLRNHRSPGSNDDTLVISIASILGLITFAILAVVNIVYDIDLAGALDSKLDRRLRHQEPKESDS